VLRTKKTVFAHSRAAPEEKSLREIFFFFFAATTTQRVTKSMADDLTSEVDVLGERFFILIKYKKKTAGCSSYASKAT
jgi:hypothetical protein